MDFQALKDIIKNTEIKKFSPKQSDLIENTTGYYTMPCAKEPFDGEVIQLTGDEFYVFFQKYSTVDEHNFREKLARMDEWFFDKPYKVTRNWLSYITKWLEKEQHGQA